MSDNNYEPGLYLCDVKLQHTDQMVLRYNGEHWWQYLAPNIIPGMEGWIGIDFKFHPRVLIKPE